MVFDLGWKGEHGCARMRWFLMVFYFAGAGARMRTERVFRRVFAAGAAGHGCAWMCVDALVFDGVLFCWGGRRGRARLHGFWRLLCCWPVVMDADGCVGF